MSSDLLAALTHHRQGRLSEARQLYEEILSADPAHPEALHLLGVIGVQTREPGRALELLDHAIRLDPGDPIKYFNRGTAFEQIAQWDRALADFDSAVTIKSDFAAAHLHRALALQQLQRLPEALTSFDRVLALNGDHAEAHVNRGNVLALLQRWDEALASYERAIAIDPTIAGVHTNRGNVLAEMRQWEPALASHALAIALQEDFAEAHFNRANVLRTLERFDAALAGYDRAIALKPDYAQAYCNRGYLHAEANRLDQALADYDAAIRLKPDYAQAIYNRSFVLLLRGDFKNGFSGHEMRWRNVRGASPERLRALPGLRWSGQERLAGRTLLLFAEQGYGDTLQFCRYAALAAGRGARVILEVQAPLVGLMRGLRGVAEVIARGESLPAFDYWCALMSLPLAFGTTLATVPAEVPYLRSPPQQAAFWKDRLGPKIRPRVGLVWSGGFRPNQPELWVVNARRNLPLDQLAALEDLDVEFHSLQKGEPAEGELAAAASRGWPGPKIHDHARLLGDFSDTAGLIENLDLVIAVDTSTAHLAGALGRPVWILNRYDSCWRWMLEREDSPWYPTAQIYRQRTPGDWEGVLARVRADLQRVFQPAGISIGRGAPPER